MEIIQTKVSLGGTRTWCFGGTAAQIGQFRAEQLIQWSTWVAVFICSVLIFWLICFCDGVIKKNRVRSTRNRTMYKVKFNSKLICNSYFVDPSLYNRFFHRSNKYLCVFGIGVTIAKRGWDRVTIAKRGWTGVPIAISNKKCHFTESKIPYQQTLGSATL